MNDECKEIRSKLIEDGTRDEMKLIQPNYAPTLQTEIRIHYAFTCANDNDDDDEIIEWCTGNIMKVGNSSNLENPGKDISFHRKDGAVEIQRDDNASKAEWVSFYIVETKKTLFNRCQQFGWRLYFDIPWNQKALQVACYGQENDDDVESNYVNDNENGKR